MTKKLKSSLIVSFFFLFGLMAALCVGAFSPALTPAKADTIDIESDEAKYVLEFYDTDNTTKVRTILGPADAVITEEMMNMTIPQKDGATFSGWVGYAGAGYGERIDFVGKTFGQIYGNRFNVNDTSGIIPFYPFFCNNIISIEFIQQPSTTLGTITKQYNEEVTENDLKFLDKPGYFWGIDSNVFQPVTDISQLFGYTMKELFYEKSIEWVSVIMDTYYICITDCNDPPEIYFDYAYSDYYPKIPATKIKSDLAKEGYKILGLSETPDSEIILPITDIVPTSNKTYYVRYQKIQTLTIKIGDSTETATVPADTAIKIKDYVSADKLKKDGYILKGFALAENGEVAYDYDTTPLKLTADLTLYAVYEKANVITVIADGEVKFTAMSAKGKTMDLGGAGIVSIMTKAGYTLKGYATAEDGEIVYEADAVITPESDLTLYAVYEENKTPGDDSGNIGDKVNDASNKISEWLKSKTGIALSSSGVIVLAVVLVLILFKRK